MTKQVIYKDRGMEMEVMVAEKKKNRKLHSYYMDGATIFKIEKDIENGLIASRYDPEKGYVELDMDKVSAWDIMKSGDLIYPEEYDELKEHIDKKYEKKKKIEGLSSKKNERV